MQPSDELQQWERIEAYYQGKLSTLEITALEQQFDNDPALRQAAQAYRLGDQALRMKPLEPVVRQAIRQNLRPPKPIKRYRFRRLAGGCVAVVGLVFLGYFTFSRIDLSDYRDDVTLTYRYRDLGNPASPRADMTPQQRAFYRTFFDAQAYLANGQPRLAIPNLETLARTDSLRPYFRQAVYWHLLNAYLLDVQPDNAAATLKLLDQASPVYPIDQSDRWKVWWQIHWQQWGF